MIADLIWAVSSFGWAGVLLVIAGLALIGLAGWLLERKEM